MGGPLYQRERPALMHVYLKKPVPALILGFPSQVTRIVAELYGMEKAIRSVRVLKEVDIKSWTSRK